MAGLLISASAVSEFTFTWTGCTISGVVPRREDSSGECPFSAPLGLVDRCPILVTTLSCVERRTEPSGEGPSDDCRVVDGDAVSDAFFSSFGVVLAFAAPLPALAAVAVVPWADLRGTVVVVVASTGRLGDGRVRSLRGGGGGVVAPSELLWPARSSEAEPAPLPGSGDGLFFAATFAPVTAGVDGEVLGVEVPVSFSEP